MTTLVDLKERLSRIETKLVRGFEEMGIDTDVQADWLSVDDPSRTIYLTTQGRSLQVIRNVAKQRGATQRGKTYELVIRGEVVGTLIL